MRRTSSRTGQPVRAEGVRSVPGPGATERTRRLLARRGRAALPLVRITSGGQTGVDRAALDAALGAGLECGGWCPPGRDSEAGPIPDVYPLLETPEERSTGAPDVPRSLRTDWNVRDADAVLLIRPSGMPPDPGTDWTIRCAERHGRPLLECDPQDPGAAEAVRAWLSALRVRTLDVAGPSEGRHAGVGALARRLLDDVLGPGKG